MSADILLVGTGALCLLAMFAYLFWVARSWEPDAVFPGTLEMAIGVWIAFLLVATGFGLALIEVVIEAAKSFWQKTKD